MLHHLLQRDFNTELSKAENSKYSILPLELDDIGTNAKHASVLILIDSNFVNLKKNVAQDHAF